MENISRKLDWIVIKTNNNESAIDFIDFFKIDRSYIKEYILVEYEDADQVSSICRILVGIGIDIKEIYLSTNKDAAYACKCNQQQHH